MTDITIAEARAIIAAAFARGTELGLKPLSIAVLDAGGHPVAFERSDGSPFMRFEIARGKAWGALAMGVNSRGLEAMAVKRPHFIEGLTAASGGTLIAVPGAVIARRADGSIAGAVGVSGDTSDNDEICAIAGIEAAGLAAQPN